MILGACRGKLYSVREDSVRIWDTVVPSLILCKREKQIEDWSQSNWMSEQEVGNRLMEQAHTLWIAPEVERRRQAGKLPKEFRIHRCLILLPHDKPPIIRFNDEIGWSARVKYAPGLAVKEGQEIYRHDLQEIETVHPPEVDGRRVAFIYVYKAEKGYSIVFDFSPNHLELEQPKPDEEWALGRVIGESLQNLITEQAVRTQDSTQALLRKVGLWAVPALLPYPLSLICVHVQKGDTAAAREVLVKHCTPDFLRSLLNKWWLVKPFADRKKHLSDALDVHSGGKYSLSIHALLPQLEGIVSDWISTKVPPEKIPFRQESKTKKFRDLVLEKPPSTYTYQRIVESCIEFILAGPVLESFGSWLQKIDEAFPNRHVVEHGEYEEALFTQENSIKLFLILDTVFHIIIGCRG